MAKTFLNGLLVLSLVVISGCMGTTRRVEVGREQVTDPTSMNIQDFETIAQRMTRSMIQLPQIQKASEPPTIAFISVTNRSNDYVDKNAFLEKMRTLLIKHSGGRMVFLDREHLDKLREEKIAREGGELTSSRESSTFYGADYFLTGVISSINAAGGSEKTIFRRYSFRLTDAHTSAIIWEDEYETQVYNERGMMYR
jgi:PBP1b-binding outer membrane lipoprotein LpoB